MNLDGVGVWASQLRYGDPGEVSEAAGELEELGYTAMWIPDVGGPVFESVDRLLSASTRAVVATGILNLWMHTPQETASEYTALAERHGDRFLVGIGVSHAPLIDRVLEQGKYRKPLAATRAYLDELDALAHTLPPQNRALAALGPKMLELAANRTRGVHPYLVTPEHTHIAREAVGERALVLPEQSVVICNTRDQAREAAQEWFSHYLDLPNYANNLLRLGFTAEELSSVSDRLFDAVIAWGDVSRIKDRVDAHRAAGADHVCVQVVAADQRAMPRQAWRELAAALC